MRVKEQFSQGQMLPILNLLRVVFVGFICLFTNVNVVQWNVLQGKGNDYKRDGELRTVAHTVHRGVYQAK